MSSNAFNALRRTPRWSRATAATVLWLLLWWLLAATAAVPYLPSPLAQAENLIGNSPAYLLAAGATLVRAVIGFAIGAALGILLPIVLGYWSATRYVLDALADLTRTIPGIALLPIFLLWFGTGDGTAVALVAAATSFIVIVVSASSIRNVDPIYLRAASALGGAGLQGYLLVVTPAMLPGVLGGLRVALAAALPWAIAGEYLGAQNGLGYILWNSLQSVNLRQMISVAIVASLIVALLDLAMRAGGARVTAWAQTAEGR